MSRPAVCTWWASPTAEHHVENYILAAHLGFFSGQQLIPHSFQAAKLVQAVDSDGAHSDSQRGGFAGWIHKQDISACFAGLLPGLRPLQAVALLFVSELGRTGLLSCRKEETVFSSASCTGAHRHQQAPVGISAQPDAAKRMQNTLGGPLQEFAGHARTRPNPAASSTRRWWLMRRLLHCSGVLQPPCLSA